MVVADFLMSPEAQAHKQDPRVWGDGTVLDLDALAPEDRARFDAPAARRRDAAARRADAGAPRAPSLVDGRDRGGVAAPVQQLILTPLLRYLPALTVGLFLGPVVVGLIGTLLPAFGYLPVLGGEQFSLEPWRRLLAAPGLAAAVQVTLTTGFASTAIALVLTVLVFAGGHGTAALTRIRRGMVPLLAVPHLALAVGLAFLIAPSGWLVRLIAPWPPAGIRRRTCCSCRTRSGSRSPSAWS